MWLLILICVGRCDGALFTEQEPLVLMAPTQAECYELGADRRALMHHWTRYDYAYHCARPEVDDDQVSNLSRSG